MVEETKHDLWLKRIQITLAIIAGFITVIIGVYNLKKNVFAKPEAVAPPVQVQTQSPEPGTKIKSALEDVGASWLESLKKTKSDSN